MTIEFDLPSGAKTVEYTVTAPGLLLLSGTVPAGADVATVHLTQGELDDAGFTNVLLGADSLALTVAGELDGEWFARAVNLRGLSPLGGSPADFR